MRNINNFKATILTNTWQTIGFATGKAIQVIECDKTGNILKAEYYKDRELTKDEIERELF